MNDTPLDARSDFLNCIGASMRIIAVTGASGFIGKCLLNCMSDRPDIAVRVLLQVLLYAVLIILVPEA